MAPENYKPLPHDFLCRCPRLWRDASGSYWCCNQPTTKTRPPGNGRVLKSGNLFSEIPSDVIFNGCSELDCVQGCSLGKGHCGRLETAFREAGYGFLDLEEKER